jgi:aryl-alcohol dehydrogenase-like predicted oxidoreductase
VKQRVFGRTSWQVGEIGYGMWGAGDAAWTGLDESESRRSLQLAADLGCTFFDTAWGYGEGRSERLLGELLRSNPDRRLYSATKIPPKNRQWPSHRGDDIGNAFPPEYIREYVELSLQNLDQSTVDLIQFHVWEDDWADDDGWQRTMDDLRRQGMVRAVGISLNRWEPWNAVKTIRTGLIDSVQVIYNIFDQAPEDELFPLCRERNIAVIARVPFDEGSLTGALTKSTTWPAEDWRNIYFGPENLGPTVERVDRLRAAVPEGWTLPELALRFILANPDVSVVIPGMRTRSHVRSNLGAGDGTTIPAGLLESLREHRWDRTPTAWSL